MGDREPASGVGRCGAAVRQRPVECDRYCGGAQAVSQTAVRGLSADDPRDRAAEAERRRADRFRGFQCEGGAMVLVAWRAGALVLSAGLLAEVWQALWRDGAHHEPRGDAVSLVGGAAAERGCKRGIRGTS